MQYWSAPIDYRRHELLIMAGSTCDDLLLIEDGAVRIDIIDGDTEQNIRFGYKGDIITALDAHLSGTPTRMSIVALRHTTIRKLPKQVVSELINTNRTTMSQWAALLESFCLQQLEREVDLLTVSPAERYHRVLQRSPKLFQEVPLKHIANYLRMSPETLSRIRNS